MFQDYLRLLQVITLFNHLHRRLSQLIALDSPWGTFFWLIRTKIGCPPAPPQPRLIVYRHL